MRLVRLGSLPADRCLIAGCAGYKRGSQDGQAVSVGHFQSVYGLCQLTSLTFDLLG